MKWFIKIGKKEHLEQVLNEGKLYLETFAYFRKCDGISQDKNDGMDETSTGSRSKLVVFPQNGKAAPIEGIISIGYASKTSLMRNICSMHALQDGDDFLDPANYKRENFALIINKPNEFIQALEKFKKKVHPKGISIEWGLVEYVDSTTYHGQMGPFRKYTRNSKGYVYENEKEFRIVVSPGAGKPIIINLKRSLADIAEIRPVEEVKILIAS